MDQINTLWRLYKQNKDIETRNALIIHYGSLVKLVVNRLTVSSSSYYDKDDLISFGVFGLIDAIEKYDLQKGVKFETYATFRIRGSIIDQIRKQDWIPRSLRQKAREIEEASSYLEKKLGRDAKDEEIAQHLSITVPALRKTLGDMHSFTLLSFEDQVTDNIISQYSCNDHKDNPELILEHTEIKDVLAQAIDQLLDNEKMIVSLYYFEQLTLKEIGQVLGVSESRVSQLHTRALLKLKNKLESF